jgi:hypothetical protein
MKHKRAALSHPVSTSNGADQMTTRGPWFRQRKTALGTMKSGARALATLPAIESMVPRRQAVQARGNRCLLPNGLAIQHLTENRARAWPRPLARRLLHATYSSLPPTEAILRPKISVSLNIAACEQSPPVSQRRSSQCRLPTFPDRRLEARASPVQANLLAHFWTGMLIKITGVS